VSTKPGSGKPTNLDRAFVSEYLKHFNAGQAYREAGGTGKNADQNAYQLLQKDSVKKLLAQGMTRIEKSGEVTARRILDECMRIAFVDVTEAFDEEGRLKPLSELPLDIRKAISGIDIETRSIGETMEETTVKKLRFWSKDKHLELLGKYLKIWTEVHEHRGKDVATLLREGRARERKLRNGGNGDASREVHEES
jgi:phage terminase small subunit